MNNNLYLFLAILSAGVGMAICRLFPFIIFANGKLPKLVKFYEKYLPYSLMAILFCYCFASVNFSEYPHGLPEVISLIVITLLHIWKKNIMLSLFLGTAVFLILSRVF
jgi:branched-chain amino acid transport protein azlD